MDFVCQTPDVTEWRCECGCSVVEEGFLVEGDEYNVMQDGKTWRGVFITTDGSQSVFRLLDGAYMYTSCFEAVRVKANHPNQGEKHDSLV